MHREKVMNKDSIVIIGAITAGGSAAFKIKRANPGAVVKVFESGEHVSYASCGLPYYISGVIHDYNSMVARTRRHFQEAGIELYTMHDVKSIDLNKGEITANDLETGKKSMHGFDKLLLATGASSIIPPLEGVELAGVVALRTLQHGLSLKEMVCKQDIRKVVIIGGGYVGLELAETFVTLGKEVRLLDKLPQVMGTMDPDMASLLEEELIKNGVKLHKGESLVAFEGDTKGKLRKVISDQGQYEADLAVLALGVRPNSQLAGDAGIKLGVNRAVAVDRYLQTSEPRVFAAGDCAEAYHRLLKRNVYMPLGTTANKQGRLAGDNICEAMSLFPGVLGSAVVKVFNVSAGRTGLTEKEAEENNLPYASVIINSRDHAVYYPGSQPLCIKLVYSPADGLLLGGQIVGSEKSVKRIDTLATALTAGLTIDVLREVDLAYAPPFSRVWDPVTVAANAASSRLKREHMK